MPAAAVEVSHLTKRFGSRTAVEEVSFSVARGEVFGLPVSPENAGEIRQRIAVMPELPGLYQLRQRVALARTLVSEPEVLFLDEPTSGLDPAASHDVLGLIGSLRDRGVTVFLTTHRLDEAERLCDRVAFMNTTLRTVGSPAELRTALFSTSLKVITAAPLADPGAVFTGRPAVESWAADEDGYLVMVSDPARAAPAVTRALVTAGADVLSITESKHSLEDVYLELIQDREGQAR